MKKWRGKVWMKERFLDSVRFLCLSALKYMANITVPSVRFNFFGRSANKKNAELHLLGVWSFTLQKFRRKSEERTHSNYPRCHKSYTVRHQTFKINCRVHF